MIPQIIGILNMIYAVLDEPGNTDALHVLGIEVEKLNNRQDVLEEKWKEEISKLWEEQK